ncbi:serine protease [Streptomyces sp. NPDC086080]|uniref:serine protease n=1 Tax=Streptomyces sp. NPDC086080 TaxID=3365748 RepID=UPI0037D1F3AF
MPSGIGSREERDVPGGPSGVMEATGAGGDTGAAGTEGSAPRREDVDASGGETYPGRAEPPGRPCPSWASEPPGDREHSGRACPSAGGELSVAGPPGLQEAPSLLGPPGRSALASLGRPAPSGHPGSSLCPALAPLPADHPVDEGLVSLHDLAGRPRGTGFVADHRGTVITSHEAVDGLPRLVLYAAGNRHCVVTDDAVTPLPALDLALVRTEGLGVAPLPVSARTGVESGTYVRIAAGGWREARVLGTTAVTYTATDRPYPVADALELAVGTAGRDALRLGGGAAGGPVLDAGTGSVLGVLGTALRSADSDVGFAVPLPSAVPALAGLLSENTATVPAYGADLNLAALVELTATWSGLAAAPTVPVGPSPGCPADGVGAPAGAGAVGPPGASAGFGGTPAGGSATSARAAADVAGPTGAPAKAGGVSARLWGGSPGAAAGAAGRAGGFAGLSAASVGHGGTSAGFAEAASGGPSAGRAGLTGTSAETAAAATAGRATASGGPTAESTAWAAAAVGLTATSPGYTSTLVGLPAASAGLGAGPDQRARSVGPVERPAVSTAFAAFERGDATVLGLVGPPGSGRSTELARLAARRHLDGRPTLVLRGADLREDDGSLADAARRALDRAAAVVAASRAAFPTTPDALGDLGPERVARLAHRARRPLLLFLDHPEEMPPGLFRRLPEWTTRTTRWLRATGARLVVACGAEYWEEARFPDEAPPPGGPGPDELDGLPPFVTLGPLTPDEAREARARHGIPEDAVTGTDARHPLILGLLAEIRAALADDAPDAPDAPDVPVDRDDVFSAYLDLSCLRIATRLAAGSGLRGTAVRRLAATVAGQVHEAARRGLGTGHGGLDAEAFEAVFPARPAPDRLGGGTGWAGAVLAEGLLVPAGTGYRFAHQELADWLQGIHLDLDGALRALVHDPRTPWHADPVPHHRVGPVVEALLLLARRHGTERLASRLADLVHALDADLGSWWAARLFTGTLARVPDATPYTAVLRLLTDRIVAWREQRRTVPPELGPAFWTALRLPLEARCALLRRLVHADGPPCESGPRFLDAAARLLTTDPVAVLPYLVRWFDDERPLPATPHATVATAAQALLHTHRHEALDALTEALADSAHRRADQLLTVLTEEEPAAMCRAVDRWARDERPARRAAAITYGLRTAPYTRDATDRTLLRYAALAVLVRAADREVHGGALALLVRDPDSRDRHIERALAHFADGDPHLPPSALTDALETHPEPVLDAFRARLARGADPADTFHALADATTPALARPVAALVRESAQRRPELTGHVAVYADRRLDRGGPADRAVLRTLLTGLLDGGAPPLRLALAGVLATPGTQASRALRRELLDALLARESDPAVMEAVLRAAARSTGPELRVLVHRTGLLLVRTPDGADRFERCLADLGRHVPGFAAAVAGWLADAPRAWAPLVGPRLRRTIEDLAGVSAPA